MPSPPDDNQSTGGTVITPVGPADRTVSPGLNGFGIVTHLVALLVVSGFLYRRRS